jgi:phosphatidylglycerophosphatase A
MPGTVGSLLGLLVVYLLGTISVSAGIAISVGLTALSWWLIAIYEAQSHKHDDSQVVIDEVVGIMICFVGISITPLNLLAGFIVFRFLDIVKPFPIGWIDKKVPGAI